MSGHQETHLGLHRGVSVERSLFDIVFYNQTSGCGEAYLEDQAAEQMRDLDSLFGQNTP